MSTEKEVDINKVVKLSIFCFFVTGIATQCFGNFIPYMRGIYGFNYEKAGILLTAHSIANVVFTLLAGIVPIYIGRKKTVLSFGICIVIAYFVFNFYSLPFFILWLMFFFTGISRGGDHNFVTTMVSLLPGDNKVVALNITHAFYAIGAVITPIILILSEKIFGKLGYNITINIVLVFCIIRMMIFAKMDIPEINVKGREKIDRDSLDLSFFSKQDYIISIVLLFCYIASEYGILSWLVTYFQDTGRLPASIANIANALVWTTMIIGRLIGAKIVKKIAKEKILFADGVFMLIFFIIILFAKSPISIVVSLCFLGFFMSTIYTLSYSYGVHEVAGNDFGNASLIFLGSLGGVITPFIIGCIAERLGIQSGMWVVVIFIIIFIAVSSFCLLKSIREKR